MTKCFIIPFGNDTSHIKTKSQFKHEDFSVNHESGISPHTLEENAKHSQDIIKKRIYSLLRKKYYTYKNIILKGLHSYNSYILHNIPLLMAKMCCFSFYTIIHSLDCLFPKTNMKMNHFDHRYLHICTNPLNEKILKVSLMCRKIIFFK